MPARPKISSILIDLSGTLHIGNNPTNGAVAALQRLRNSRIPYRFCSNTSKESTRHLESRLRGMGFEINLTDGADREVWTSLGAAAQLAKDRRLKRCVLLQRRTIYPLISWFYRPFYLLTESARAEFESESSQSAEDDPYDSVIIGYAASSLHYDNLNKAFRILRGEHPSTSSNDPPAKVPFIATHRSKYMESPEGGLALGPGPFVKALEDASGVDAEVVGKPTLAFFNTVLRSLGEHNREGRVVIIGDDVEADLGGAAVDLNFWRVLGTYYPAVYELH